MTTQQKKPSTARHGFKTGESIVYPAHGVGTITAIEEQEVAESDWDDQKEGADNKYPPQ